MIRKKTYWLMLSMLVVGLLSACSADTDNSAPDKVKGVDDKKTVEVSQQEITFNITGNWNQEASTRVTAITSYDLKNYDIRVDAYFHSLTTAYFSNAKLRYHMTFDKWYFYSGDDMTHYYWPIDGSSTSGGSITVNGLDFVGYLPYNLSNTCVTLGEYSSTNGPSFSCELPVTGSDPYTFSETDQTSLQEFMYAYKTNQKNDYDGNTPKTGSDIGKVELEFQHPFALVNLYLKSAKLGTFINTVELSGISTSGTFTHSSGWSSLEKSANLKKTVGKNVPSELNFNALIGGPYMVIPQTLTGSNNLTVNKTYSETTGDVQATINDTWAAGMIYNYYLDLGKDEGRILVDVVIEPWQTHTVPTIDVK